MKAGKHAKRVPGAEVSVDERWMPAFGRHPAEIVRGKPTRFGSGDWDYLVEWATGEREWVVSWAVHDPTWNPKTGEACSCGQVSAANMPVPAQW